LTALHATVPLDAGVCSRWRPRLANPGEFLCVARAAAIVGAPEQPDGGDRGRVLLSPTPSSAPST